MKKWIYFSLFFIAIALFYLGCQKDDALASIDDLKVETKDLRQTANLGESFTLFYGDVITVEPEGFTIFFQNVSEDSRCPLNANCIWEGRAVVELELEGLDEYKKVSLATPNSRDKNGEVTEFMGYSITLEKVVPYPESSHAIPMKQYRAVMKIGREKIEVDDNG